MNKLFAYCSADSEGSRMIIYGILGVLLGAALHRILAKRRGGGLGV